ncbi:hypothetical protein BP6252_07936 [Coleophoma cylindrospora]|uniref:DNA2/NAM7 helicase helicase domain-containing protein n=1 Tax=Coleophoma cylindrospora TaxID=1849047 RepID=A0A3D8RBD7_9HELO|nr:hypothetical protein BP6252_07936 [Coleophoma cylindrospora]
MSSDDDITWVRAIIDPRAGGVPDALSQYLTHPANKPVGVLYNPHPTIGAGGQGRARPKAKAPSIQMQMMAKQPDYQPDDRQEIYLGIKKAYSLQTTPPALLIRYRVMEEELPTSFGQDFIRGKEVIFKISFPASVVSWPSGSVVQFWDPEKKQANFPQDQVPKMLTRHIRFNDFKSNLFKFTITINNNPRQVTQEHVANDLEYKNTHTQRTVDLLRAMVVQEQYTFDIYMEEDTKKYIEPVAMIQELRDGFIAEKKGGNVYRHFYVQNLLHSNAMHNLNSGSSLKAPDQRPNLEVQPSSSYTDLFEFTTRQGVAVMQTLETTCSSDARMVSTKTSVMIKSLNSLAHGKREVLTQQGSKLEDHPSAQSFGKLLLMHDSIPEEYRSCVNDEGLKYLEAQLTDPDHKSVIKHVTNLPVKQGKGVGMLIGCPGSGKTRTTAEIVAAILKSDPKAVVLVTALSNQSVNVIINKISEVLNSSASVVGFTIKSLGSAYNYCNLPKIDYLIVNEAGKVNLADLVIPLANLEVENLLLVGDGNQLAPTVPFMVFPGCTRELGQSAITYFRKNHWGHAILDHQRRGASV